MQRREQEEPSVFTGPLHAYVNDLGRGNLLVDFVQGISSHKAGFQSHQKAMESANKEIPLLSRQRTIRSSPP